MVFVTPGNGGPVAEILRAHWQRTGQAFPQDPAVVHAVLALLRGSQLRTQQLTAV